jgi:hypothetical protein
MKSLNPEGFAPVLFLVHKDGKRIYPVARWLTDLDTIKRNIMMIKDLDNHGKQKF